MNEREKFIKQVNSIDKLVDFADKNHLGLTDRIVSKRDIDMIVDDLLCDFIADLTVDDMKSGAIWKRVYDCLNRVNESVKKDSRWYVVCGRDFDGIDAVEFEPMSDADFMVLMEGVLDCLDGNDLWDSECLMF